MRTLQHLLGVVAPMDIDEVQQIPTGDEAAALAGGQHQALDGRVCGDLFDDLAKIFLQGRGVDVHRTIAQIDGGDGDTVWRRSRRMVCIRVLLRRVR